MCFEKILKQHNPLTTSIFIEMVHASSEIHRRICIRNRAYPFTVIEIYHSLVFDELHDFKWLIKSNLS
ncbi:hypothetical protein MTR_8g062835 [Medicago truncatula]|uniref:Uncharacterized protein n=1 Tax=Medicago truncatula TaxID=3880 RepID=A0A072TRC1_MEDTR|nr:hypothetical protein MTR_8g062835 [Medicago truncatula]